MSKPFVTNALGEFVLAGTTGAGALFRKEVIREGEYQHPVTPWDTPLVADKDYLDRVALNTNEALDRGIEVPVPDTHADKPGDNKGYVRRVYVDNADDGSPALFADVEIVDPDTLPKVGETIRRVSGWFTPFGDGEWAPEDGDRLRHVALTNYPVASRQGNFVALADSEAVESDEIKADVLVREAPRPGDDTMKFNAKQIEAAKALGIEIPEDGTVSETALDALLAAANKPAPKPAPAPVGEDAAAKALSIDAKAERFFSDLVKVKTDAREAEVAAAKQTGRLTEAGAKALDALLAVNHAYALSTEGAAEATDVAQAARDLVASLPENASVPLDKRTLDGTPDPQKVEADKINPKALADEALAQAGLAKSKE